MLIERTGVILFVEHYDACVAFYRDKLMLPVIEQQSSLVSFAFGNGYLMIERGGVASRSHKTRAMNPTVLRFDVHGVAAAAGELRDKDVGVEVRQFDWGTIAVFFDPDNNRCELKEAIRSASS